MRGRLKEQDLAAFRQAAQDPVSEVRETAAHALGRIPGPVAMRALLNALRDRAANVRTAAADALRQQARGGRSSPTRLTRALASAARAEHASRPLRSMIGALVAWDAVAPAMIPWLVRLTKSRSDLVRGSAARALGSLGPAARRAEPALLDLLDDGDLFCREDAVCALLELGGESTAAARARVQPRVRKFEETFAKWGPDESLSRDRDACDDLEEDLRSLGPLAAPVAPALVLAAARDRILAIRLDRLLFPMGPDAVPPVVRLLTHQSWRVRALAAVALGGVGPAARGAVPALLRACRDRDAGVRRRALLALARVANGWREASQSEACCL